jgi:hypothetical protein
VEAEIVSVEDSGPSSRLSKRTFNVGEETFTSYMICGQLASRTFTSAVEYLGFPFLSSVSISGAWSWNLLRERTRQTVFIRKAL